MKEAEPKIPTAYKTGDWDGKMSDLCLCKDTEGKYHLAHVYEYEDGQFEWYDQDDYGLRHDVSEWVLVDEIKPLQAESCEKGAFVEVTTLDDVKHTVLYPIGLDATQGLAYLDGIFGDNKWKSWSGIKEIEAVKEDKP